MLCSICYILFLLLDPTLKIVLDIDPTHALISDETVNTVDLLLIEGLV